MKKFCWWHKWEIIYDSASGLFIKVKCKKCGREQTRGTL